MLEQIKSALAISPATWAYDREVQGLIDAAKADLTLCGVHESRLQDDDPLIKRAVTAYCKAGFSRDPQVAEGFQKSYDTLKKRLALSRKYTAEAVS